MEESEAASAYREHLRIIARQKLSSVDKRRIDEFVYKMRRRVRGAKFGAHDPLFSDEATNANQ